MTCLRPQDGRNHRHVLSLLNATNQPNQTKPTNKSTSLSLDATNQQTKLPTHLHHGPWRLPRVCRRLHLYPRHLKGVVPAGQRPADDAGPRLLRHRQLGVGVPVEPQLEALPHRLGEALARGPVGRLPEGDGRAAGVEALECGVVVFGGGYWGVDE